MKEDKIVQHTFYLPLSILNGIRKLAIDTQIREGKKVTQSQILLKALAKLGIK